MKYVIHLTDDELKDLINQTIADPFARIEKSILDLAEQKNNELLKIEDVMRIMKVSKKTVNNWVKKKKLRCHWLGGKLYFKMKDIMDSLEANF